MRSTSWSIGRNTATIERLRLLPLFAACNSRELDVVASRVTQMAWSAGHVLVHEGVAGHEFFLITAGSVEVQLSGRPIATLGEGDFFGELSMIDHAPRTASVVATSDLATLVCGRAEFAGMLALCPDLNRKLLEGVSARMRALLAS
jgi:CRP/FNR family cyclic AMP-dependent transcriptional regulator